MSNLEKNPAASGQAPKSGIGAGVIGSVAAVALLVILMLQNRQKVSVNILFWNVTWSLWLYGLLMAVVGALAWFGFGVMRRRSRRKSRQANR